MIRVVCSLFAVVLLALCWSLLMKNHSSPKESSTDSRSSSITSTGSSPKTRLELGVYLPKQRCIKGSPCLTEITVHNPTEERVEIAGLGLWLRPYQGDQPVDFSGYLSTSVDLVDLARLKPNKHGAVVPVEPNTAWTKEVDLTLLEWHKSIQSSLSYKPLWDRVDSGKYEVRIEIGVITKANPPSSNANIGGVEVTLVENENLRSDWKDLEFLKQ